MAEKKEKYLKLKAVAVIAATIALVYLAIAWFAFEYNNPTCNEMAFFKHFKEVVTFKKMPEYQTKDVK